MNIRRVSTFDAPGLEDAWARLSAVSPRASLFSTYEWCRCWAETVGRRAEVAILLFEDAGGQVIGLLPACIERTGPARWLKFLGRERVSGDHLDLLCASDDHAACLDALVSYLDECGEHHGIVLGELEHDSLTLARLVEWADRQLYSFHQREPRVVPYVHLPATFEDYLASLSTNMRYHVRRRRRDLAREPAAGVELLRDADVVLGALDDLYALHEQRWRRDGYPGVFQQPAKREFMQRFCAVACARGWVRCYVLIADGVRCGVLLAFHWRGTASYYQMGWAPDGPLASPGVLLLAESIEQAIREGLDTYDFLRGDEEYKRKWTSDAVAQRTLVVGQRIPARAAIAAEHVKDRIKWVFHETLGTARWEQLKRVLKG